MEYLQHFLPKAYEYHLINFSKTYQQKEEFNAFIRVNIHSKENAEAWLEDFQSLHQVNFTVSRTYLHGQSRLVFKKDYRCHHNTRASFQSSKTKNPSWKHANCQASLRITVKKCNMERSQDVLLSKFPCEITIKHNHNHLLEYVDTLRYCHKGLPKKCIPTKEMEEKLLEFFSAGHSPASALDLLKYNLQEEYGDEHYKVAANSALYPNLKWVYQKYSMYKKEHGLSDNIPEVTPIDIVCPESDKPMDISVEPDSHANESLSESEATEARRNKVSKNLQRVFHKLAQIVRDDNQVLYAAENFVKNFDKMKTSSVLVSSLRTFGKQQLYRLKKKNTINAQPTSQMRRKSTSERHYSNTKDFNDPIWLVPRKKRKSSDAPHFSSHLVE